MISAQMETKKQAYLSIGTQLPALAAAMELTRTMRL
jgi:hypothetical protein